MAAPARKTKLRDVLLSRGGSLFRDSDLVAAEEPLAIQIDGEPFAVIMRTPGDDAELAAGFLHGEGIVTGDADVLALAQGADPDEPGPGNVVDVRLAEAARLRMPRRRLVTARSACGVCGRRTIEEIHRTAPPVHAELRVDPGTLLALPDRLAAVQEGFKATGGLHAAGLFDRSGAVLAVREDVGRHNAVDKVVGHALLNGALPLSDRILLVSGRAGFEIVEKAVRAGIPVVCSLSAPSSLALELAESANVAVVGFLRNGGFNVYTAPHRITFG